MRLLTLGFLLAASLASAAAPAANEAAKFKQLAKAIAELGRPAACTGGPLPGATGRYCGYTELEAAEWFALAEKMLRKTPEYGHEWRQYPLRLNPEWCGECYTRNFSFYGGSKDGLPAGPGHLKATAKIDFRYLYTRRLGAVVQVAYIIETER